MASASANARFRAAEMPGVVSTTSRTSIPTVRSADATTSETRGSDPSLSTTMIAAAPPAAPGTAASSRARPSGRR